MSRKQFYLWFWFLPLLQIHTSTLAANFNFTVQKCRTAMPLDTAQVWYYQGESPDTNLLNNCMVVAVPGQTPREIHLFTLKSRTPIYHWGSVASDKYLTSNSGIPNANAMNNLIHSGAGFLQGGGFYVSTDIIDSSEYGSALGLINSENNFLFANYDELFAAVGAYQWNDLNVKIKLRETGVAGTYMTSATPMTFSGSKRALWISVTDHIATKGYRSITTEDVYAEIARPDSTVKLHGMGSIVIMGQRYNLY